MPAYLILTFGLKHKETSIIIGLKSKTYKEKQRKVCLFSQRQARKVWVQKGTVCIGGAAAGVREKQFVYSVNICALKREGK